MSATRFDIAERLREVRGDRTLVEFADSTGITRSTVNRCEMVGTPSIDTLVKIATTERINLNWLITGNGRKYIK